MIGPARTVFLGSGSFAVPIVDYLHPNRWVDLVGVVSSLARTPVSEWVADTEFGRPVLQPRRLRDEGAVAEIAALEPDLLILADYGRIVPQAILDLPRHGALNIHPSLLPRHRGASPIPAAILAGDAETGVTLLLMDSGLDSGPVIAQRTQALAGTETAPELESTLASRATDMLEDELPRWLTGTIQPHAQPSDGVTMSRPLKREDGRLDPLKPAPLLARQVRAFQPWPGTFFENDQGRFVVWRAEPRNRAGGEPGVLWETNGGLLAIETTDGLLELVEVQPAGGRRMSGQELLRGRPGLIGSRIESVSGADPAGTR